VNFEVVDPDDVDQPINDVPLTWADEKMHELMSDWSEELCWCEPRIDGKYVRHRSVFDAIDIDL
jgi:hypothetical protein